MYSSFFKNKKILITGATGVIGANLCKKIKEFDCEIHVNFLNEIPNELNDILFVFKIIFSSSIVSFIVYKLFDFEYSLNIQIIYKFL